MWSKLLSNMTCSMILLYDENMRCLWERSSVHVVFAFLSNSNHSNDKSNCCRCLITLWSSVSAFFAFTFASEMLKLKWNVEASIYIRKKKELVDIWYFTQCELFVRVDSYVVSLNESVASASSLHVYFHWYWSLFADNLSHLLYLICRYSEHAAVQMTADQEKRNEIKCDETWSIWKQFKFTFELTKQFLCMLNKWWGMCVLDKYVRSTFYTLCLFSIIIPKFLSTQAHTHHTSHITTHKCENLSYVLGWFGLLLLFIYSATSAASMSSEWSAID